ncbi:hypothetical protein LIER_30770 [Lithospermum erythrorhizon]|uniref:Uncharacterized protein n=1 Tax=Lithospermum erythrorhizon TaxID=34254 RepID=A0AAV3RU30_LITER
MLTETRDDKSLSIELQDFEPKVAVHQLKIQLSSHSGVEIVRCNNEVPIASRSKRVVIKLQERESIGGSEEDSGKLIVIPVGHIDPKRLGFAK